VDEHTLAQWWTTLGDPQLTSLIERALVGNPALKQSSARIQEARAQRRVEASHWFPAVGAGGSVERSQSSRNALGNLRTNPVGRALADQLAEPTTMYSTDLNASWEVDLFGRIQRQNEAAQANLQATQEDRRDIRVSLLAEVALAYVDVRLFQARLALAAASLEAQAATVELLKARERQGEVSRLDLEQAQASLKRNAAGRPALSSSLARAQHQLEALLGLPPGALSEELLARRAIPAPPDGIALGLPAEMLRRRPDIRRAERDLAVRTAQIGIAMADKYPQLDWHGTLGLESISSGNLLSRASLAFAIGPSVKWDLFDAGRVRQQVQVMNARHEEALIAFDAAVLKALHEVEDALAEYGDGQLRQQSLVEAERSAQAALGVAQDQLDAGERDQFGVMEAQRALLDLQDQRAEGDAAVAADVIRLYRALGGGLAEPEADGPKRPLKQAGGVAGP
jgi:NodT family efflux transporter outer membrane factor (OMF) lipoprotein